ncbi:hypothetical protein EV184_1406 [Sinorhizobium americanum]|uniref:Uncharacterized protein n=1 Tax=Sinorhizobium americanum TaxID=194963 RepID=A0A4R2ATW0_9HYPH|nr:hypothetical protein EV184_1406 [Sinorhizobium americanum]
MLEGSEWLSEPLRVAVDEDRLEDIAVTTATVVEDDPAGDTSVELPAFPTEGVDFEEMSSEKSEDEQRHVAAAE